MSASAYSARMRPPLLKTLSAACKIVVEEATFTVSPVEGLSFRAMDQSHIELVHVALPPSAFESFACEKEDSFSLRAEDLAAVASRLDSGDGAVTLAEGDDSSVVLGLEGKTTRTFSLHTLDGGSGTAPLPKLEFTAKAALSRALMERVLGDMAVVADQVTLDATPERLAFSGRSEAGSADVRLAKGDLSSLECGEGAKATYSIDYLAAFLKHVGGADEVTVEFGSRKPVRLTFALGDQGGLAAMYLAPRVSE